MTVEGEKDDITGLGQTEAAQAMVRLDDERRQHFVANGVGHYGVFNGSRWRSMILPEVRGFIRAERGRPEARATMADAIRIGDPAIEVALRRNARARRMVLRVAASGRGATLTLPPGIALAHAARLPERPRGLASGGNLAAVPARDQVGEGSVLPFGDTTLTLRGHAGRASSAPATTLLLPGAPAHFGPRAAAWLRRGGAADLRRRRRPPCRSAEASARGGSASPIRAPAGGPAPRPAI